MKSLINTYDAAPSVLTFGQCRFFAPPSSLFSFVGSLLVLCLDWSGITVVAAERELIRDPHFQNGFYLLETKPGKRVPYGGLAGTNPGTAAWDLAQWSSRFPLQSCSGFSTKEGVVWTNRAKTILVGLPGKTAADLSLRVKAGAEYPRARRSIAEPWVHLLVQQELENPPSLGGLTACKLHVEACLKRSVLVNSNDYSPAIHAAQYLIYLTLANRNPNAAGYQECFWFGIPIYDNRDRVVPAYEAQDFGDTKLFIFTPASDNFARQSVHDGGWVTVEKDLLPLMREGLQHAQAKGFVKGPTDLVDYRPLGIFVGWEVPGVFDVDLQIRNLSLKAVTP